MKNAIFLGIDAGTTKLKVALLDVEGRIIDLMATAIQVMNPFEGACEIDMHRLWLQMCELTRNLEQRNKKIWNDIVGVGITGQGDGFWPIDEDGNPVRNAILWNDTRTRSLDTHNKEQIEEICIKNYVTPMFAGAAPMILKWMSEYEQKNFQRVSSILHCKDWLNYKLTGKIFTDYSDASTAMMNIFDKKYEWRLLDLLDLSETEKLFPKPLPSTSIIGGITKSASLESGIKIGTPIIAGAIDIAAVGLGMGMGEIGEAGTIVGTTLGNEVILDDQQVDHRDTKGSILCHIIPERYIRLMATVNGTSTLDWTRNILVPQMTFEEIEDKIQEIPIGSNGIIYHPYLNGERAPFRNPFACGGFYGLTTRHTNFDMIRAAYEGLALSLYDCYENLPSIKEHIYISGGGSESNLLCQMFSDCLGKTVLRPTTKELGISGIVMALKIGLGYTNEYTTTNRNRVDTFVCNPENHQKFMALYHMFKNMRVSVAQYWEDRIAL